MSSRAARRRLAPPRLRLELLEDRSMLDAGLANAATHYDVSIQLAPNDASFSQLWGLNNTGQTGGTADADIDAPEAWNVTTGSYAMTVGIIDTGIDYRHPDLYQNIWINPGEIPSTLGVVDTDSDGIITFRDLNATANSSRVSDLNKNGYIDAGDLLNDSRWENGVDNDGNGYKDDLVGWNFVNNTNDPFDDNQHGTHVAGTIGATGNNSVGVVGINWNVRMVALKILDASGYADDLVGATVALNYATAKGIKVTNSSWGYSGDADPDFGAAIAANRAAGFIFVAAAGNSGTNNNTSPFYPANYTYDNVLSVAASTSTDSRASFSNYGSTTVDLAAPGQGILSTTPNNTYSTFSGTSMASPHVAGAVALLWSKEPTLTYGQVISRLLSKVDVKSAWSGVVQTGGRLNIYNALAASSNDTSGPRVIGVAADGTTSVSKLTVTFNEAVNPSTFTLDDIVSFTGPNGPIAVTGVAVVAGSGNTKFDLSFASQTAVGSYALTFGPNLSDTLGNLMNQDGDANNGEATQDRYTATFALADPTLSTFTNSASVAIRDFTTSYSSVTIGSNLTVRDINVKVNLTHTYDGDLYVYLRGPGGQIVNLVRYRGGSGDNFTNTIFDDEAAAAITSGSAPYSASFRPEASLAAFDGSNAKGTWTLYVYDNARGDVGKINSWSLIVQATPGAAGAAGLLDFEGDTGAVTSPADTGTASGKGGAISQVAFWLAQERQGAGGDLVTPSKADDVAFLAATVSDDHRRADAASAATSSAQEVDSTESLFAELAACLVAAL